MLRGRIMALNGADVDKMKPPEEGAWVLRGDRGITYAAADAGQRQPDRRRLVGRQLRRPAAGLVLVPRRPARSASRSATASAVNVLGRDITARIANLRRVEWEKMGIDFVMVFSPNAFAGAPHSWLATLTEADGSAAAEAKILNAVTRAFPAVTTVRVKDALDVVNRLVGELGTAIRAAASVALIASVLGAFPGALAAGQSRPHPQRGGP